MINFVKARLCNEWHLQQRQHKKDDGVELHKAAVPGERHRQMHSPLYTTVITHKHSTYLTFPLSRCLKTQEDYSACVSGGPCWHGNSSLNKTNHRHGSMLIKTKAYSATDGTSHQIMFPRFQRATIVQSAAVIDSNNRQKHSFPSSAPDSHVHQDLLSKSN